MTEHEDDLRELFYSNTATISQDLDQQDIKAMSFEDFKKAADKLMDKGYYYGKMVGLREAQSILNDVFTK